jgi:hypothetical protein
VWLAVAKDETETRPPGIADSSITNKTVVMLRQIDFLDDIISTNEGLFESAISG